MPNKDKKNIERNKSADINDRQNNFISYHSCFKKKNKWGGVDKNKHKQKEALRPYTTGV